MLGRLKKKIVLIITIPVWLMIAAILTTMSINAYTSSKSDIEHTLVLSFEDRFKDPPQKPELRPAEPNQRIGAYITVLVDESGKILEQEGRDFGISEESLAVAIAYALESDTVTDFISSEKLMYMKRHSPDGTRISFSDTSQMFEYMNKTILICILLAITSLVLLLIIGNILAGIIISPVKKAWNQQKQFIADASHELKTPLTVILANNNILLSHRESSIEEQLQWVQSTAEESIHMKKLIDNMLFLARADEGKEKIAMVQTDVSEVIEKTVLHFEPIAFEKGVELSAQTQPGIFLLSNEGRLSQLFQTLTDNAIKYTEKNGTVKIRLFTEGNSVKFTATNPGFLSDEDIEHIFDRFYRSDTSRSDNGYGLGLAIAKSITDSLGGEISVSCKEGKVLFTVEFRKAK